MRSISRLLTLFHLSRISKSPGDYRRIEAFRRVLRREGFFQDCVNHLMQHPNCRKMFENKFCFDESNLNLSALKKLPAGTLGYEYTRFLENNKLDPVFYSPEEISTDEGYFIRRTLQTHDIWHVVLGINTDELDEMKLQLVMYAQLRWPNAVFFLAGYIFRLLFTSRKKVPELLDAITAGWILGRKLPPLFGEHWEAQWSRPLSEIRDELENRKIEKTLAERRPYL